VRPKTCGRTAAILAVLNTIVVSTDLHKAQLKYRKFRDHYKNCRGSLYRARDDRCGVHGVLLQLVFDANPSRYDAPGFNGEQTQFLTNG
jgi:hypothetical protein